MTLQELDKESYELSEVVLTGNLTKDAKKYKVTVSEVLKGVVDGTVLSGLTEGGEENLSARLSLILRESTCSI